MKIKGMLFFFAACLLLLILITIPINQPQPNPSASPSPTATASPLPESEVPVKGVWVATVANLDYPSQKGLSAKTLTAELQAIVTDCVAWGITDIYLQVRPHGDALYPSKLFPWSLVLSGTEGVAPDEDFDPLAAWLDAAHANGLRLHAWINPYRLATGGRSSQVAEQHPDWVVAVNDGLYLDPGNRDAMNYIVSGIDELCQNYAIDGIHFDDYFYPSADFSDEATFRQYGDQQTLEAWRIGNVNTLIAMTHDITAQYGRLFGVSPAGIWANADSRPNGSETAGRESLIAQYADSLAWLNAGWVDYIVPQIYWERGHATADFTTLLHWWQNAAANSTAQLYVGLAVYKQVDPSAAEAWQSQDEIAAQLALIDETEQVDGVVFFNYTAMKAWLG